MRCKICQKEFIPSKYHPHQEACARPECQKLRQIQSQRQWRLSNPDYFKSLGQDPAWRKYRHKYTQLWKATHKEHLQKYSQSHKLERKEYMREYMRKYRAAGRNPPAAA